MAVLAATLFFRRTQKTVESEKKLGWQNSLDPYLGIGYDTRSRSLVEMHRWPDGPPDPHPTASSTCPP
jgi:hypothetical protein